MNQLTDDELRRELVRRGARPAPPWLEAAIAEQVERVPRSVVPGALAARLPHRLAGWSGWLGRSSALLAAGVVVIIVVALVGAVMLLKPALVGPTPSASAGPSPTPTVSGSPSPSPSPSVGPTPTATTGTTYRYLGPVPALSRICDGSEAGGRVTFQTAVATDIPGEQVGRLTVWLTGSEPCWLEGFPSVTLVDRTGKPLAVRASAYPGSEPPALLVPGLGEPDVADNGGPFGQSASAFLGWWDWCGPPVDGGMVTVALRPGGTPFTMSADLSSPTCISNSTSSSLDVGRFVMASAPPADLVLPSPTPVPSAGRSCTAADLSVRFDPYVPRPDSAGGGHGADLTVWDRGSTPCDLQGVPGVTFVDGSGRTFSPTATSDGSPTPSITLLPGLGEPSLATAGTAGSAATTGVLWQPDCGTRISGPKVTAVLRLKSGTLQVHIPAPEPICPSPPPGDDEPLIVSAWAPGWLP
ncbi:MAG TPA: DUF4232 domain-containing protein [Candidatus Limnocylindrales bacterium]|nr:DUF4232 domain-containing protein [Candidatus Limnocylindrales bacterium]